MFQWLSQPQQPGLFPGQEAQLKQVWAAQGRAACQNSARSGSRELEPCSGVFTRPAANGVFRGGSLSASNIVSGTSPGAATGAG